MILKALSYIVPAKKRKTFNPERGLAYMVDGELMVVNHVAKIHGRLMVVLVPAKEFKR